MSAAYWLLWLVLTAFNAALLWAAIARTKHNLALVAQARRSIGEAQAILNMAAGITPRRRDWSVKP